MTVEGSSVALFGGVACSVGSHVLPMPPGKPSLLLALLALEAGRVVRTSAVIDGLWDDDPPASARALVHTYVSALRRALDVEGAPPITTAPGGYRLDCDPQVVDVHRVLAAAGLTTPSVGGRADGFRLTAAGWGGDRLRPGVAGPRRRRAEVLLDRLWAHRLDEGGAAELLPELRAAVGREPLREDRVLLLARALGQVGRVDDAMHTLDSYRRRLGEELGLDPSAAVPALRQTLIARSPSVEEVAQRPSREGEPLKRQRGLLLAVAATAAIVAGVVVLVALQDDGPTTAAAVTGPALISVDPSDGSLSDSAELPVTPSQIEADGAVVWVRSVEDQAVAVLDLGADGAAEVTGVAAPPSALALDNAAAVVGLGFSGETVTVSNGRVSPPTLAVEGSAGRLTLAGSDNGVWVATITGDVHAPDGTAGWQTPVSVGVTPLRLGVDGTRAWVITSERAELVALDASDNPPVRSPLRGEAVDLTTGDDQAWAVTSGDDRLWHAAATGRVVATRVLPGTPTAVLLAGDAIWVTMTSPPRSWRRTTRRASNRTSPSTCRASR